MDNELISVIVPIYKVEKWLDSCIRSIREQTYQNLQIILVDDGGAGVDNCPQICDFHAAQDSRIIVIHKENGGRASARNAGLSVAKGNYIFWVDGDDMIMKEAISKSYDLIKKNHTDGVAFSYWKVDENTLWDDVCVHFQKDDSISEKKSKEIIYSSMDLIRKLWGTIDDKKISEVLWNKLYKKEIVDNIAFKDNFFEDAMWLPEVYLNSKNWCVCDEPLYLYRIRKDSAIHSNEYLRERLGSVICKEYRKNIVKKTGDRQVIQKATREYLKDCIIYSIKIPVEWEDAESSREWLRGYFKKGYKKDFLDLKVLDKIIFGCYYIFPELFQKLFRVYIKAK